MKSYLLTYLLTYCEVVVRPVLEYACPVWHYQAADQNGEDVQRRAVQIIAVNIPYSDACESMGISSLADRPFQSV